ncbi:hypothetical protein ACFXPN_28800 [Streptomyces griseorubiginosus]|uniref:hypothetical protein n=1 Tax=Streptomyces griseorubiginosus TaxID=67304 RepID=UPI00369F788E
MDEPEELERLRARVAELEARQRSRRRPVRSLLAALLVVLGCVLAPLSVVASWSADVIGDTGRYVKTVEPLADDPDIQREAARRVTDAVMSHLDLTALLSGAAPAERPRLEQALGKLGDSIEDAVRSFVQDKAQSVIASDTFHRVWRDANRRVHSAVEEALTGSADGALRIDTDTVTLDLGPVVEQVKQRLVDDGMGVAAKIPSVHTNLTLVEAEDIGRVRTYFRLSQLAGTWLPVLSVALLTAGVLLARNRRRALIAGAVGFALATALLGVGLTVARVLYLDALPAGLSQPAAGSVYDVLTRFLRRAVRVVVALGAVTALAAWLTGPGPRATRVRRLWTACIGAVRHVADRAGLRTGPVGPFVRRFRGWIVWGLVAAAVLTYLLWSYPTGWVVFGLALTLLFALAVVEFLAAPSEGPVSVP